MQIEQYHRREQLLGSAGNVIVRQPDSWSELARLGQQLTEFGFAAEEQRLKAQYHNQFNNAKLEVDKRFLEFEESLDPNKTDTWLDDLDIKQQTYGDIKLSNSRAKTDFSVWLEEEKLRQRASISNYRRATDARNFAADYQINYRQFMEMASKQPTPGDYQDSVLSSLKSLFGLELKNPEKPVSMDNLQTIEGYENPLFHTEKLRLDQARAWLDDTQEMYKDQQIENITKIYEQMALNQPEVVLDAIQKRTLPDEIKNDPKIIAALRTIAESTIADQERLLRKKQDLAGNKMLLDFLNGQLTEPKLVLEAQEKDEITASMATSLIKSMRSGEARETNLRALNEVNEAIDRLQDNPTFEQKQKTLEVLYANETKLSNTDAKSKLNEIYSDLQTAESQEDRMAYADMNGILGGRRDPLTLEYFFEDDKAKEASIKGRLLYDEAVAKAKAEGKPLTAEQKTMLAVRIARQLKRQLSEGKTGEEILPPAGAGMILAPRTLGTFKVPSPYPEISTDAEYDTLPHGAIFIDKQTGLTYRKP